MCSPVDTLSVTATGVSAIGAGVFDNIEQLQVDEFLFESAVEAFTYCPGEDFVSLGNAPGTLVGPGRLPPVPASRPRSESNIRPRLARADFLRAGPLSSNPHLIFCVLVAPARCLFAENPPAKRKRSATADMAPVLTLVPFEGEEITTNDVGTAAARAEEQHDPIAQSDDQDEEPQDATDEEPQDATDAPSHGGELPRSQRRRCDNPVADPSPRRTDDDFEETVCPDFLLS